LICLIMYKQISMFLKDAHEIQKLQLVKLLIFLMMHKIKSVISLKIKGRHDRDRIQSAYHH
jgi:hypothetical protein